MIARTNIPLKGYKTIRETGNCILRLFPIFTSLGAPGYILYYVILHINHSMGQYRICKLNFVADLNQTRKQLGHGPGRHPVDRNPLEFSTDLKLLLYN